MVKVQSSDGIEIQKARELALSGLRFLAVGLPSPTPSNRPSSLPVNGEGASEPSGALHRLDAGTGARSQASTASDYAVIEG